MPSSFPNERIAAYYLHPVAERDQLPRFEWGVPLDSEVEDFCRTSLGWTRDEFDRRVKPVLARYAKLDASAEKEQHSTQVCFFTRTVLAGIIYAAYRLDWSSTLRGMRTTNGLRRYGAIGYVTLSVES